MHKHECNTKSSRIFYHMKVQTLNYNVLDERYVLNNGLLMFCTSLDALAEADVWNDSFWAHGYTITSYKYSPYWGSRVGKWECPFPFLS